MPRDDFSPNTRRILGERVAYICSNPNCRGNTIGPHSDPDRSLDTGIAGHIFGAAPGGPRYNPNQTPEERKGIANGVWLCATCSRIVDTNDRLYPAELLREWRVATEQWVSGQENILRLPDLRIENVQGLSMPLSPGVITAATAGPLSFRVTRSPRPISRSCSNKLKLELPEQPPPKITVSGRLAK
jgi:hypothetical protein